MHSLQIATRSRHRGKVIRPERVESFASSASERRYASISLVAILGVAAWFRFFHLAVPGLWLDEILGVMGVGPEHGPIYYSIMRATTRTQPDEWLTRLPFAIAGMLSIAVAFAAGYVISGRWLAVTAAAFVATSPIHVYYSREARPSALLMLCGFAGLLALAFAARRPTRLWQILPALAAALAGAVWTSANGIFVAASLIFASAWIGSVSGWRVYLLWLATVAALAAGCVLVVRSAYPPATNTLAVLPTLEAVRDAVIPLVGPMVSGHREHAVVGTPGWIGLSCAFIGALAIGWLAPRLACALVGAAFLGLVLPPATMLWLQHGISVRYALAAFPAVALLVAGPAAILDAVDGPWRRDSRWLLAGTLATLAGLGVLQSDARRSAFTEKADWRKVAALVVERTAPGDPVVISNDWSTLCLQYYLPKGGDMRRVENVHEILADAQRLVATVPRAILVAGGDHFTNRDVPQWMRTFPSIWNSAREDISISFYPDRFTYLTTTVTAREVAADEATFQTMMRSRIDMTVNARRFLLSGWQDAEVYHQDTPFRWAGPVAAVYLPVSGTFPTMLTTKARPHPRLVDRALAIWINGVPVSSVMLNDEWTPIRVPIPRSYLRTGANILELRTSEPPHPYDRGAKAIQGIEIR